MMQTIPDKQQKINPPTKKIVAFYLTEEASGMLDELTTNRSWLVEKMIRDAYVRERELARRGKVKVEAK